MPLITRTITNTGSPLYTPDGILLTNIAITFELVDNKGMRISSWDAITGENIVGDAVNVTTDAQGEFSVHLWPNTRGNKPTRYLCTVHHPNFRPFFGAVEDVPGELPWVYFMAASTPLTEQEVFQLRQYIDEIETLVAHADVSASSALGSANLAAASAAGASAYALTSSQNSADAILAAGQSAASADQSAASANASALSSNASEISRVAAAGSADAAALSANTAQIQASLATEKAGVATDKANLAVAQVGLAAAQASTATTKAQEAAASATLSQKWATQTAGEVALGQGYGAKKYAQDASASATTATTASANALAVFGSAVDVQNAVALSTANAAVYGDMQIAFVNQATSLVQTQTIIARIHAFN